MAFPTVKIIPGKGTSGQAQPGEDYISGSIFYTNALPSGFSAGNRMKQLFGVADAEAAGILADYSDETQATLAFDVTGPAVAGGDIVTVKWNDPILGSITLCTYLTKSSDSTDTILATSIAAAITANKSLTGFSAVNDTVEVVLTVPKGLGIYPNANFAHLTAVVTGADGAAVGAVELESAGIASLLAIWHYHIAETFRTNANCVLWVGFFAVPGNAGAYTYTDITTLQTFADGKIRNFSVYAPKNYAANATDVKNFISNSTTALQAQYTAIFNNKQPGQILFATDLVLLAGIANLTLDLATLSNNRTSVIIGQDGANLGYQLFITTGFSITMLGATLGILSLSAVSDDIGDLGQFNMTSGAELAVPAFGDGTLVKNVTSSLITQLDLYRYIFITTYQGKSGSFINNDHTATAYSDQFSYIHFGRTWDKSSRQLYVAYLPYLKAKFSLSSNGQLSPTTQATLQQAGQMALDPMVQAQDLSGYTVAVPANQNPNTTGKLVVTVHLLAMAIANEIDITSTFVASL